MVRPISPPPADQALDCDICIVGGGAAGLTLALDLIGTAHKVLLVDPGRLDGGQTSQDLYEGEVVNPRHAAPHLYRHRRLGGSTAIWGGRCIPFDPIDFERRSYVELSGWPFNYSELEAYYPRAQELLEAGTYDYSAASAIGGAPLVSGFDDPNVLSDSLERFSLPTNFWREYRREISASPNVQVIAEATAVKFRRGGGDAAAALACVGPGGGSFDVRARVFVVAAGGLETVRLLGYSGMGDTHGLLGRTYMCHVESNLGEMRLAPATRGIRYGFERTHDGVYARRRFTLAEERQRELGVMSVAVRPHHPGVADPSHGHPVLSAMFLAKRFIIPEYARRFAAQADQDNPRKARSDLVAHIRNVTLGAPALAGFVLDWTYRRYLSRRRIPYVALPSAAGVFPLDLNAEQEPNLASRVLLTDSLDRNGTPRLRIDWRLTQADYRTVTVTLRELRAAFRRTGCGDVAFDDENLDDLVRDNVKPVGGHHIGTARMAASPSRGVVDAACRLHDVPNLYIAGAATFPTSSHANPTLTIVAMALRLGAHLRAELGAPVRSGLAR
ncbi:GMC family oxidoreductase [Phenylobacterium sp.]|uniref:GMC family oxidoreductase n=1 Tax=Phenylobacterium sp. TaxID=1871053 RepID=UPI00301C17D2